MKIKNRTIWIIMGVLLGMSVITIPFWYKARKQSRELPAGVHEVMIREVVQTSNYTYFFVEEGAEEYWIAVTRQDASEGDILYFSNALEMNNFQSKELGRSFEKIFFVQDLAASPEQLVQALPNGNPRVRSENPRVEGISVPRPADGVSIAELYEHHASYAGKSIKVRGVVTRFSSRIMGTNWAHIQDGTEFEGNFDLAVSTADSVVIGNTVTFSGTVRLNRDLGAGYFYKILLEDARVSK